MNRLSNSDRVGIVSAQVEGRGIDATCRMTGVPKPTVLKLQADLGKGGYQYHYAHVRGLKSKRVQCDEIWSFVGAKMKNTRGEKIACGWGDTWKWTVLDADSKLMVSYLVGQRGPHWAIAFMQDLASRIDSHIQITTEGLKMYAEAIEGTLDCDVDYAMLIKLYGNDSFDTKYSPGECVGTQSAVLQGNTDPKHISTSIVERQNSRCVCPFQALYKRPFKEAGEP